MGMKEEFLKIMKEHHPETLKDIRSFQNYTVQESLRVTSPDEYLDQKERLEKIQNKYKVTLGQIVADNHELLVTELLELLSTNYLTFSSGYITADTITCS